MALDLDFTDIKNKLDTILTVLVVKSSNVKGCGSAVPIAMDIRCGTHVISFGTLRSKESSGDVLVDVLRDGDRGGARNTS